MKDVNDRNRKLLLAVAPYMHLHFNVYDFLDELARLVEVSPAAVADVFKTLIEASGPIYDYEDRLQSLIKRLAELGQKPVAIECCNKLITIPGMDVVFRTLTT